jgi:hypothetical protein
MHSIVPMSDTQGNSEIPLPTIRAPLNPDVAPAEDQDTVAPLPTLRGPTLSSMDTSVARLPTLRAARAATPVAFEPEDENAIVLRETRETIAIKLGHMSLTYPRKHTKLPVPKP